MYKEVEAVIKQPIEDYIIASIQRKMSHMKGQHQSTQRGMAQQLMNPEGIIQVSLQIPQMSSTRIPKAPLSSQVTLLAFYVSYMDSIGRGHACRIPLPV